MQSGALDGKTGTAQPAVNEHVQERRQFTANVYAEIGQSRLKLALTRSCMRGDTVACSHAPTDAESSETDWPDSETCTPTLQSCAHEYVIAVSVAPRMHILGRACAHVACKWGLCRAMFLVVCVAVRVNFPVCEQLRCGCAQKSTVHKRLESLHRHRRGFIRSLRKIGSILITAETMKLRDKIDDKKIKTGPSYVGNVIG